MNRIIALLLLTAALSMSACNKIKHVPFLDKSKKPETASTAAVAAPLATPPPAAPPPDLAVAQEPAKPEVNLHSSVVVLCYHNVEDKGGSKALTITTTQFEKELLGIKEAGFSVIGMQDFLAFRRGTKEIPAKSCIITIDDGWVSAYTNAWPLLKKYGYPFTLFIYVNYVGTGGKSLTWEQLGEMRDAGVDIQSHTYSHSNLKIPGGGMDRTHSEQVKKEVATLGVDGWMRKEIVESKAVLEKQLGIKCNAFAYPFGVWNTKARELVKEAGYEAAFTVYGQQLGHNSPPYDLLGRYAIEASKPQIFTDAMKMVGGGTAVDPLASSTVAQLAASSMVTQPMEGETIKDPHPTLKANLETMGAVDPGSVQIRLSGVGKIPVKYDPVTHLAQAKVTQTLEDGDYSVILTATAGGDKKETRWTFHFSADGKGVTNTEGLPPRELPPTPAKGRKR